MPSDDDKKGNNAKGPWGNRPGNNGGGGNKPPFSDNAELEEIIKKSQEKIQNIFSGGKGGGSNGSGGAPMNNGGIILAAIVIAFFVWLASGVYTVNTKEEGVVLRFGEYVRTESAGLHYHAPFPIEKVIKLRVTDRYRTELGYRTERSSTRSAFSRGFGRGKASSSNNTREVLMLTGDENIVDVNVEVQWQISDAEKYLFNVFDPKSTVKDSAESAIREVVGTTPLNDILSDGRTAVQLQTKELLQSVLDQYDIGIKVEEINMRGVPPRNSIRVESMTTDEDGNLVNEMITTTVDEAFKDVQAAISNKEETINSAIARSNELIPQARGRAQRLLQEAKGYKEKVIAQADGEAKRFLSVYNEYRKAKDVTRNRMYIETMEKVLKDVDKMMIDTEKGSGVLPYLPLNEIKKR